jgi:glycerophosphoryl diester phosphodiesterase
MNRPTITAHSGCEGTIDGSMAAILRGIELGAELVEVDVRRAGGSELMLSHDAAADPAGLVSLKAAFAEIKKHPGVGINCDLKEYGLAPDVMALAEACGLMDGQLSFSGSLTPRQLMDDKTIVRRARVYLNIEEALSELYVIRHPGAVPEGTPPWHVVGNYMGESLEPWVEPLIETCRETNAHALNLPPRPFIRPYMNHLGGAGVRLSTWTINEPDDMRELFRMPWLENLTTRRVALALSVRAGLTQ